MLNIKNIPLSSVNMPDMSSTFMRPTPIKPLWISAEEKHHHYSQADGKCWIILNEAVPLKKSPLKSKGGETNGESNFTIDFITISKAFLPYCKKDRYGSVTGKPSKHDKFFHLFTHLVVKVKPAEVSGFCRSSVSVRESTLSQKKV